MLLLTKKLTINCATERFEQMCRKSCHNDRLMARETSTDNTDHWYTLVCNLARFCAPLSATISMTFYQYVRTQSANVSRLIVLSILIRSKNS